MIFFFKFFPLHCLESKLMFLSQPLRHTQQPRHSSLPRSPSKLLSMISKLYSSGLRPHTASLPKRQQGRLLLTRQHHSRRATFQCWRQRSKVHKRQAIINHHRIGKHVIPSHAYPETHLFYQLRTQRNKKKPTQTLSTYSVPVPHFHPQLEKIA